MNCLSAIGMLMCPKCLRTKLTMHLRHFEIEEVLMNESVRIADENDKLLTTFITNNSDNVLGPGVFMIMTSSYPFPQLTPQIDEILFRAKPYFKNHPYVKKYLEAAQQNMEKIHTGEK